MAFAHQEVVPTSKNERSRLTVAVWAVAFLAASSVGLGGRAVHAQAGTARQQVTLKSFAGTWNLMFGDKRFATLVLNLEDGQLAGSMSNGSMEMDKNGRITRAEAGKGTSPVVRTSLVSGMLHIVEKGGKAEIDWAMTLRTDTTAELKVAGAGAPANAESIRLEKVWSEPPLDK
jgi:hypothetical protein